MSFSTREHVWSQVLEDCMLVEMTVAELSFVDDLITNNIEAHKNNVEAAAPEDKHEAYRELFFWVAAQHEWHARREVLEAEEEAEEDGV